MPNVYETIGVRTIINASGPSTRLSGGIMDPEVADAMHEASQYCVDIAELQARASEVIAEITGAEAGYVTSGAAAGLLLGTAACVTGPDPGKMNRLPDTEGMKNEVIMSRSQRNFYDHAIRSVGVKLVEVGIADRYSGAGVRDTEAWEIADAITERTAAVCYVANPRALPPLEEVVEVAHARGVPVIVDAAGQLPPRSNLQAYISMGADLVAFSGGKAIGGPQGSGILCGRRDLIMCVALQHLDMDVLKPQWNPPESLIDKSILPGAPHHGIGRPCKVGKEQIVGLLTALERFAGEHLDSARRGVAGPHGRTRGRHRRYSRMPVHDRYRQQAQRGADGRAETGRVRGGQDRPGRGPRTAGGRSAHPGQYRESLGRDRALRPGLPEGGRTGAGGSTAEGDPGRVTGRRDHARPVEARSGKDRRGQTRTDEDRRGHNHT